MRHCKRQSGWLREAAGRVTITVMIYRILIPMIVAISLPGCSIINRVANPAPPPVAAPIPAAIAPMGVGQAAEDLDKTTAADKAAAVALSAGAGARELGRVVVGLGSPAEQGFWLKSPLIAGAAPGRVVTEGGKSVAVDLIPGTGAALLSLAAYRALGLALTDLPEVTVFAD